MNGSPIDKYDWKHDDEKRMEYILDDILSDFSDATGLGSKGYEELSEFDSDYWEWAYDLGKKSTGILDLYMLAFKLAMEQLKERF